VLHKRLEVFANVNHVDDRFQTGTCEREKDRQHSLEERSDVERDNRKQGKKERVEERTIFDGNGRNGETVGNEEAFEEVGVAGEVVLRSQIELVDALLERL
jgi:hypothetical protein